MNGYRLDLVVKFLEVHNERFAQSFEKILLMAREKEVR